MDRDKMREPHGGRSRGGRYKGKGESRQRGAKTFRRGRALAFLEMMQLKRSTIQKQLDAPEFQSIHQVLVGELKAIDMVIDEFVQLFDIHESETEDIPDEKSGSCKSAKDSPREMKGAGIDETN